ncbi:penicillin acylase family protein [Aliiglaciecola sp. CAU 1673]|uniref:penicillin acylase family protein n=1 Tax=Aliiglaciecola sp. CAU 1673 TaxID=3032595 RepID=UPI0023DB36AD|nr:penicillin acylase family protein [Aliiglaciecola sp. CAU 1673]MDF2177159.1 penicillin acylase family protein [Aliiglaciecola sp. CAU 1673]
MAKLSKRLFQIALALLLLLILMILAGYGVLRASLPQLEGEQVLPGLQGQVSIERDAGGMAVLHAEDRIDLARALGYVHGQDRFFQMDLLRRSAAGELSALFGEAALERDKEIRLHRFRHRAQDQLQRLPGEHLRLVEAYAEGVNQGLASLNARPFEYFLLGTNPSPWQPADSLLSLFAMYLDLQYHDGRREFSLSLMKDALPYDLYHFLHPAGSQWDATIDGSDASINPLPQSAWPKRQGDLNAKTSPPMDGEAEDLLPGSNNWAVGGALTPYGSAMLADDMHLGIRVPNIWFKAQFNWQQDGQQHQVTGVTLPGTPLMVVGSNTKLAWGFTNSYGDWSDLIRLQLDESGQQYLTPEGYQSFTLAEEEIAVKDQPAFKHVVRETIWGPVIGEDASGNLLAYRWVAHDPQGANLNLMNLETAKDVYEGAKVGASAGIPAQNLMMADAKGNIGWTIAGPMPVRIGYSGDYISDWSDGSQRWDGYLSEDEYPRIINPEHHRLWTGNSRVVGGEMYDKIGNGGYALGARSKQIRDDLFEKQHFTEQDLLAIQLDDEAIFLTPWRNLLLREVLPRSSHRHKERLTQVLENWSGHASIEDLGYLVVRQFRLQVRDKVYRPLNNAMTDQSQHFNFNAVRNQLEAPLWQLVSERPNHLLPADYDSWNELLENALGRSLSELDKQYGDWRDLTWGEFNKVQIQHPMSRFVPLLGKLTDMPQEPQAGDTFMPRVARGDFGSSQRLVVSPGHEDKAIFHMPSSQSGHPLSPFFGKGHEAWRSGTSQPLLPGPVTHKLQLMPNNS